MGTITHNVKLTDADIKKTAVSALEFCLEQTLKQFELKHKVDITGIKLTVGYSADGIAVRTGDLRGVQLQWQETGEGIRTDEEVRQLIADKVAQVRNNITDKLAGNEQ